MYTDIDASTIELALRRPDSFGYRGDLDLFETWGLTIGRTRDSAILDVSNFEVITRDMLERFPDDCEIVGSSHWANGWADQLAVRVLVPMRERRTCRRFGPAPREMPDYVDAYGARYMIAPAFREIMSWRDTLESYPAADDSHLSALEHAELIEHISSMRLDHDDDHYVNWQTIDADDWQERFARELFNSAGVCRTDDMPDDDVCRDIAKDAGILIVDRESLAEALKGLQDERDRAVNVAEQAIEAGLTGDPETLRHLVAELSEFGVDIARLEILR